MTTLVHDAALAILRQSLDQLDDALAELPDDATGWTPAPGTNSAAVLVAHSVSSTRFWLNNGSGNVTSHRNYMTEPRVEAFQSGATTTAYLQEMVQAFRDEAAHVLAQGTERDLAVRISWADEGNTELAPTGAEALFRGLAHLREHIGQVELLRDLWKAR